MHKHGQLSMIVFVIHHFGVVTRKHKGKSPISTDIYGPGTGSISAQFMQPKSWQIHVLRLGRGMESTENETEFLCMGWPDSGSTAGLKESAQPFVLKTPDHAA